MPIVFLKVIVYNTSMANYAMNGGVRDAALLPGNFKRNEETLMFKKSLALVLALVLCLGVFAGCQQDTPDDTKAPETTAAPAGDTTAAPAETTEAAPQEYTFPAGAEIHVICGHDINDLPLDKFVEEATGLSVKWTPLGSQDEITAMLTQKGARISGDAILPARRRHI